MASQTGEVVNFTLMKMAIIFQNIYIVNMSCSNELDMIAVSESWVFFENTFKSMTTLPQVEKLGLHERRKLYFRLISGTNLQRLHSQIVNRYSLLHDEANMGLFAH